MDGADQVQIMLDAVQRFSLCQSLEEIGAAVMEQLARGLGTAGGSFFLHEGAALRRLFSFEPDHVPERIPFPLRADSPFQRCLDRREPLVLGDDAWEGDCSKSGWKGYANDAALLLPFFDQTGEVMGLASVHNKANPPFTKQDLKAGQLLAAIASETIRGIRANDAVRESERRMSALLTNMPGVAYRAAGIPPATMEYVSEGSLAITGHGAEDLRGKVPYASLVHPEDWTLVEKAMRQALETGEAFQVTYRILDSAGREKWVWHKGVATAPGAEEAPVTEGFITDITRQRASEVKLARIATALDQASEGILITSRTGIIEYANQSFERITGYNQDEVLQQHRDMLKVALDRTNANYAALRESQEKGRPWKGEIRYERKDGARIDVMVQLAPLRAPDGEVQSFVYVVSDMTAERRLKEQLINAQKMEAIGVLASGIAHEINTPTQYVGDNLRFILESFGHLEQLVRKLALTEDGSPRPDLDAEIKAFADEIDLEYVLEEVPSAIRESLEGNSRVAEIVRAMKAFAHPDDEAFEMANINEAVRNAAAVGRNEWKYVADFEFNLDEDLPDIPCQLGSLNQVILNVVVNAAHAIAERREKEGMEEKGRITVSSGREDNHAVIRVSDTGAGIPREIRAKIFDPFFTTKNVGKGTGQGLALSHTVVVEQHRGSIDIESTEGEGTTFIIRLPMERDE